MSIIWQLQFLIKAQEYEKNDLLNFTFKAYAIYLISTERFYAQSHFYLL